MLSRRDKPSGVWPQLAEYKRVERFIKVIHALIGALALGFLIAAVRTACADGIWEAINTLDQLAFLASASLVTFVAHRQITHANVAQENQRRADVVRVTHHLIAVVCDLQNRTHYTQKHLYNEKTIPTILRSNAETIKDRFELFYARENFLHLSIEATQAIHSLSGSIFGMTAAMLEVASMRERHPGSADVSSHIRSMAAKQDDADAFRSMKSDLERLEETLRELRSSIEKEQK